MEPTQAGFLDFVRNVMQISTTVLPDSSPSIATAYSVALEIVNDQLALASSTMYTYAVYNLAGDNLVNYAPDQQGQTYFADLRKTLNLAGFVSGVIQASSDESTSESMVVQDAAKEFTLADLQNLKTPWGRTYLGIAQRYGTVWGLT